MKYIFCVLLLAGAVLGFGQETCQSKWHAEDIRLGDAAMAADISCASWILGHIESRGVSPCQDSARDLTAAFDKHHDAGPNCKAPAKPVAPSKQKITDGTGSSAGSIIYSKPEGPNMFMSEKQLGEWINKHCHIMEVTDGSCAWDEASKSCVFTTKSYELHCMGSKP